MQIAQPWHRGGSHQFVAPARVRLQEDFDDPGGLRLDNPSCRRDGILPGVGRFELEAHAPRRVRVPEAERALQLLSCFELESKIAWRDKKQVLRHLAGARLLLVIMRHSFCVFVNAEMPREDQTRHSLRAPTCAGNHGTENRKLDFSTAFAGPVSNSQGGTPGTTLKVLDHPPCRGTNAETLGGAKKGVLRFLLRYNMKML